MERNDGGPAFPVLVNHVDDGIASEIELIHEGMSLRNWFAGTSDSELAKDMTLEAGAKFVGLDMKSGVDGKPPEGYSCWAEVWAAIQARLRYIKADALLKEGEKGAVDGGEAVEAGTENHERQMTGECVRCGDFFVPESEEETKCKECLLVEAEEAHDAGECVKNCPVCAEERAE